MKIFIFLNRREMRLQGANYEHSRVWWTKSSSRAKTVFDFGFRFRESSVVKHLGTHLQHHPNCIFLRDMLDNY
jgi:hypothetical protein